MTAQEFKTNMTAADTFRSLSSEPFDADFWHGYRRGLQRNYHGEKFGTEDEHNLWRSCADETRDIQRKMRGLGYRCGFEGQNIQQAMKLLAGRQYMSDIGSIKTEKSIAASRRNAKLGGRPKGPVSELTALQQQAYDLRHSGMKIKEVAKAMGRQPETIRQLIGRAETKIRNR